MTVGAVHKTETWWKLCMYAVHASFTAQCQAMQQAVTVCSCYESDDISWCMVNILASKWLLPGKRQTWTTWASLPTRSEICVMLYNTAAHKRQWLFHAPRPCAYVLLGYSTGVDISHHVWNIKHLHNVETRFYCPQTFLHLDFQCRDDVSELKYMFRDWEELLNVNVLMSGTSMCTSECCALHRKKLLWVNVMVN